MKFISIRTALFFSLVLVVLFGFGINKVGAQTTPCYTYQPVAGQQNPLSILQRANFSAQNSSCAVLSYSPNDINMSYVTNTGLISALNFSPMNGSVPSNYADPNNPPPYYLSATYADYNDISTAAGGLAAKKIQIEDALINTIDTTHSYTIKISGPRSSQTMSAPATNCVALNTGGLRDVVFLRGKNWNSTVSEFMAKVDSVKATLISDGVLTSVNYSADLKKLSPTTELTRAAVGAQSSCNKSAQMYIVLDTVRTSDTFLTVSNIYANGVYNYYGANYSAAKELKAIYDKLPNSLSGNISPNWVIRGLIWGGGIIGIVGMDTPTVSINKVIGALSLPGQNLSEGIATGMRLLLDPGPDVRVSAALSMKQLSASSRIKVVKYIKEAFIDIGKKYSLTDAEINKLFVGMVSGKAPFTINSFTFNGTFNFAMTKKLPFDFLALPSGEITNSIDEYFAVISMVVSPPAVSSITPVSGAINPNTFRMSGSGFSATGNSIKLIPVTTVSSEKPSVLRASPESFFDVLWNFFKQAVPKAHGQTSTTSTFYGIDDVSGSTTSITFSVPTTTPDGTYRVSVSSLNSGWTDTQYTIVVRGNGAGDPSTVATNNLSSIGTGGITPPVVTTSPFPSNLAASNVTQTAVTLTWNHPTDTSNYNDIYIYRNGSQIRSQANIVPTTYTDTGLTPGTTYRYKIAAGNYARNLFYTTNEISVTTASPVVTPPVVVSTSTPVAGSIMINSGGGASGSFMADTYFSGGSTYNVSNAINTSSITSPAAQTVYQSERYGRFSYIIPNLTPGSSYNVTLYFAENYWNAVGKRIFHVSMNGTPVLTYFDIYREAGAQFKTVSKTLTVNADATGKITIAFAPATGTVDTNAKVDAISIVPAQVRPIDPPVVTPRDPLPPRTPPAATTTTPVATTTATSSIVARISASPMTVNSGQSSYLSWSCSPQGSNWIYKNGAQWGGGVSVTNISTGALTQTSTFVNRCNNDPAISASVTITVAGSTSTSTARTTSTTTATSPAVAAPTPTMAPIMINSGGGASGSFVADKYYSGGGVYNVSNTINTSGIINPAAQTVYQNLRYGTFTYTIPNLTAGAQYSVQLFFTETYWNAVGKRIFNVSINGTRVIDNLDVYRTAGAQFKTISKTLSASADATGKITIAFTPATGTPDTNTMVDAIIVAPAVITTYVPNLDMNISRRSFMANILESIKSIFVWQ